MNGRDGGFTLLETLVVLSLVVIGAGAASALAYGASHTVAAVRQTVREQQEALRVERVIRETVAGVKVPYWERDEAGYVAALRRLEAGAVAGGLGNPECTALRDRFGRVRGLSWRYRAGGREYRGEALFASVPVMGEVFP